MYTYQILLRFFSLLLVAPHAVIGTAMSNTTDNLFWFLQVTDLHFSIYEDPERATDLLKLFTEVVPTVRPELVIVSGDLADSKSKTGLSSMQIEEEWRTYKYVMEKSGILSTSKVLDIRGNHDMFGVFGVNSEQDYFSKYAVQGMQNHSSYMLQLNKPFGKYGFVMVDTCPHRGARFPFNFFGEVTKDLGKHLTTLTGGTKGNNHTFWVGHYPTSTITSPWFDFRGFLGRHAYAFLCGHLHTALGLVPRMYSAQREGYLELELGDWRSQRYYRVLAVDHDLVSFIDYKFPKSKDKRKQTLWPIVLVTNPKDAKFLLPQKEPVDRIANSKYIRILAWSNTTIANVSVWIDDNYYGQATQAVPKSTTAITNNSLFVLPWDPMQFTGIHTLRVQVTDQAGQKRTVTQPFMLGGTPQRASSLGAQWILRSEHTTNIFVVFYVSWIFVFSFVLIPQCIPDNCFLKCGSRFRFCRGLYRFSRTPSIFGPVIAYLIYELIGPTFIGFIVPGHFGAVFSFGIVVSGTLVLEPLTYMYELIQLWLLFLLIIVVSIQSADVPLVKPGPCGCPTSKSLLICSTIFTVLQLLYDLFNIGLPIGVLSGFLCPGRLLPIALSWYLTYRVPRLP